MAKSNHHYDKNHNCYLNHYGDTFQAHRPADIEELHAYLNRHIGFTAGDKVLDAGCGVCGPAMYFAKHNKINIDAITNSEKQIETAQELIAKKKLKGKIKLYLEDYHNIDKIFQPETFDKILFLESYGHSDSKDKLLSNAYGGLKFGGILYIKDYFAAEITGGEQRQILMRNAVDNLAKAYCYYLPDLYDTLKTCRTFGFQIEFVRKPDFELSNEHVVGAFEKELNIDLFGNDYMPIIVEPLELKLKKIIKDVSI